MSKPDPGKYKTVTVVRSEIVDDPIAMLLHFQEGESIAFAIDLGAIALLRKQLEDAEKLLRQKSEKA
jgi:AmiR/NasT family two-component response regulator